MTPEELARAMEEEFKLQHARMLAIFGNPMSQTNRDFYAAHAMQVLMQRSSVIDASSLGNLAATSFAIADAMMQVRDMTAKKEEAK